MTLFSALRTGVTGIDAQSQALGVVSDNIANVNTIGFKAKNISFASVVTQTASSTRFSPGGVSPNIQTEVSAQGLVSAGSATTDLAIQGNGFFVVTDQLTQNTVSGEYDPTGRIFYTRAGNFRTDASGNLRNPEGFYLLGYPRNDDNSGFTRSNVPTNFNGLNVGPQSSPPIATTEIALRGNLNANVIAGGFADTQVTLFDRLGTQRQLALTYTRATSGNENTWFVSGEIRPQTIPTQSTTDSIAPVIETSNFFVNPADRTTSGGQELVSQFALDASGAPIFLNRSVPLVNATVTLTLNEVLNAASVPSAADFALGGILTQRNITGVDTAGITQTLATLNTITDVSVSGRQVTLSLSNVPYPFVNTDLAANQIPLAENVNLTTAFTAAAGTVTNATGTAISLNAGQTLTISGATAAAASTLIVANNPVAANNSIRATSGDSNRFTTANILTASTASAVSTIGAVQLPVGNAAAQTVTYTPSAAPNAAIRDAAGNLLGTTGVAQSITLRNNGDTATNDRYAGGPISLGLLQFNNDGSLSTFTPAEGLSNPTGTQRLAFEISYDSNEPIPTLSDDVDITLNFGSADGIDGITQFRDSVSLAQQQDGAAFTLNSITQNGRAFGALTGVTVETTGVVSGVFDNGDTRPLYEVPVGIFNSPNELTAVTGTVFTPTLNSGQVFPQLAGRAGAGIIRSTANEASTVDIATEFTNLITAQRAFSANTRVITTSNELLQELVNVIR